MEDNNLNYRMDVAFEEIKKQLIRIIGDKPEHSALYEVIAFEAALRIKLRLTWEEVSGETITEEKLDELYKVYMAVLERSSKEQQ